MEFVHEFSVPVDADTAFAVMTDLEKVAPCLPGAALESVDGDTYTGRVKVKLGPLQMTYGGTARVVETDATARTGRIEAAGKEMRGGGTAKANVVATLTETGQGTDVQVITNLNVTGKPAQFGRGALEQVGTKIIDEFARRLRTMFEQQQSASAPPPSPAFDRRSRPDSLGEGGQPAQWASPASEDDALDLLDMVNVGSLKRLVLVSLMLALVALVWHRRRQ